jgi:hypothetical protein
MGEPEVLLPIYPPERVIDSGVVWRVSFLEEIAVSPRLQADL